MLCRSAPFRTGPAGRRTSGTVLEYTAEAVPRVFHGPRSTPRSRDPYPQRPRPTGRSTVVLLGHGPRHIPPTPPTSPPRNQGKEKGASGRPSRPSLPLGQRGPERPRPSDGGFGRPHPWDRVCPPWTTPSSRHRCFRREGRVFRSSVRKDLTTARSRATLKVCRDWPDTKRQ